MVTSGYVGVGICIGIGLFYWCGVLLMIGCMQYSGDISRYTLIASTAFPRWGRLITSLLFYLETLCTLLGFLIAVGDLAQSIPTHVHHFGLLNTREFATFVAMVVIVPATWFEKLSTVSFFSLCCTLGLLFVMVLTIYIGFFGGVGFKARIPLVLSIAFGVFTAVFLLFGLLGSFMFGFTTAPLITQNLPSHLLASSDYLKANEEDDQACIPRGGRRRQYVRRNVTGIDRKELLGRSWWRRKTGTRDRTGNLLEWMERELACVLVWWLSARS
ncbi:amino acid transporter AVT1D [Selaginella moellendorffii]|uniref:amino acid transporter AVT1D n=1 Tax=Selaginella moellendorffii TaxID=88036 RepID=UPI000D1CF866|nr:amino acid transporter AVT1D [Selaginella moellendorffii]|eukprot:XP_024519987.1 amino acid transporter AVT1D [Selaginella moellendorffii]